MAEELLTASQAAAALGIPVRTLLDLVMDGEVSIQQEGRGIRLRRDDLVVLAETHDLGPIDLTD
ncbi:MAG: helix-turn-helix domain-containing protein [Acidimicrobiales bacterium]|nr:helix-turn-helix domain-containing protein [Acidimicrobiales bacterium]